MACTTRTSPTDQLATTRPGSGHAIAKAAASVKLSSMKLSSTKADSLALACCHPAVLLVLLAPPSSTLLVQGRT